MTTQKQPVTAVAVGEAIFQFWRNGQNATVESVMKALGSTHRQKVNDLMAEGRVLAGEMIKAREAESQLDSEFPAEAFGVIRDWAKKVAEVRLQNWEASLKDREAELADQKQTMESRLQTAQQQIAGFEIQNATLQKQLSDSQAKAEQTQASFQAKCDGLEAALSAMRERAGIAEARLGASAQALKSTQAELAEQKQEARQLAKQHEQCEGVINQLTAKTAQVSQQLESLRTQANTKERQHQEREAAWLSERDELIRNAAENVLLLKQMETRLNDCQNETAAIRQLQQEAEQGRGEAIERLQKKEHENLIIHAQLESERSVSNEKVQRLADLEKQNAALQTELIRLKS